MKRITLLLSFFLFLTGVTASGQTKDNAPKSFSVKEAVDYALEHQKNVKNASLDARISDQQVKEIIGIGLPQVNGSVDIKDFFELPTSLIPGQFFGREPGSFIPVKFGTQWQSSAGITASQLVFDPTYLIGLKATRTIRELANKNVSRTRIETGTNVTKAYYALLLVRQRREVIDANISRVAKLQKDTRAMFENGFVEKVDVDRIDLIYNNLLSEKQKFDHVETMTELVLKFQMGMDVASNIELKDSLDFEKVKNLHVSDGKADVTKRVVYGILETQVRLEELNVKRYRSGYYPSLVAFATANTMAMRTEFNFLRPGFRWYPTGIFGATLNIPIFDGFQKNARIRQSTFNLNKVQNELEDFRNAATMQIENSRSAMEDAIRALELQDQNMKLAEEVVRVSKIKYDQGVGSNLEVLNSETSLKEAQTNYYIAVYDAIVSKIDYETASGNLTY